MRRKAAIARRLALVSAIAMLAIGLESLPLRAQDTGQDTPQDEVEARPNNDANAFVPPMFGAPDKRIGAGSRELGRPADPCSKAEPETGTEETARADCVARSSEPSDGEVAPVEGDDAPAE